MRSSEIIIEIVVVIINIILKLLIITPTATKTHR